MTVFIAGGTGKMAGHSMIKYMKAKTALKTTFTLLNRVPAIDVASVKGIALVCLNNCISYCQASATIAFTTTYVHSVVDMYVGNMKGNY